MKRLRIIFVMLCILLISTKKAAAYCENATVTRYDSKWNPIQIVGGAGRAGTCRLNDNKVGLGCVTDRDVDNYCSGVEGIGAAKVECPFPGGEYKEFKETATYHCDGGNPKDGVWDDIYNWNGRPLWGKE